MSIHNSSNKHCSNQSPPHSLSSVALSRDGCVSWERVILGTRKAARQDGKTGFTCIYISEMGQWSFCAAWYPRQVV